MPDRRDKLVPGDNPVPPCVCQGNLGIHQFILRIQYIKCRSGSDLGFLANTIQCHLVGRHRVIGCRNRGGCRFQQMPCAYDLFTNLTVGIENFQLALAGSVLGFADARVNRSRLVYRNRQCALDNARFGCARS